MNDYEAQLKLIDEQMKKTQRKIHILNRMNRTRLDHNDSEHRKWYITHSSKLIQQLFEFDDQRKRIKALQQNI